MLFFSLVLVVFMQWLGTTAAVKKDRNVPMLSEEELEALKWTIMKQRKAWGKSKSGHNEKMKEAKEQVSRIVEKFRSPLDKIQPTAHRLGGTATAVVDDGWHYFEKNMSRGTDRKNPLKKDRDFSLTQQQASVDNEEIPMSFRTDERQDTEETTKTGIDGTTPVKNEYDHGLTVQLNALKEEISTTFPKLEKHLVEKAKGDLSLKVRENSLQGRAGMKGIIGDPLSIKERMQGTQRMRMESKKGERKAEMFAGESGNMEERMREREMMKVRLDGEKKNERIIAGSLREMKERMRERGKLVNERMEAGKNGERVVEGLQRKMKERLKVEGDRKQRERDDERVVMGENKKMNKGKHVTVASDKDDKVTSFDHQGKAWLPRWLIKKKSKGGEREWKLGNVLHFEVEKEREWHGHKVVSI